MKNKKNTGMTLPEAIIGFLVASIITLALVLVTKPLLQSISRTKSEFSNRTPGQELTLMKALKQDTACMLAEHHDFKGNASGFSFLTLSQINNPASFGRAAKITYSVKNKKKHSLTRTITFLNPDKTTSSHETQTLVTGGASPVKIAYWDGKKLKSEWKSSTLPDAVKLIPQKPFTEFVICTKK